VIALKYRLLEDFMEIITSVRAGLFYGHFQLGQEGKKITSRVVKLR
jgi:hypothetical protein